MGYEVSKAAFTSVKPANLIITMGKGVKQLFLTIQQEENRQLRGGKQFSCPAADSMDICNAHLSNVRPYKPLNLYFCSACSIDSKTAILLPAVRFNSSNLNLSCVYVFHLVQWILTTIQQHILMTLFHPLNICQIFPPTPPNPMPHLSKQTSRRQK